MHEKIVAYRKRYGDNWLTIFPESLEIPWRQLTLQEFLDYDSLFRSGRYTAVEVEDEIFCTAVLNSTYIENIDILPAGVVSVVASQILEISGVQSPEQITQDLNLARDQVQDFISSALTLICSVFPAYTPEAVLALNYQNFMRRLAMAERRLLELGVLKEPISVLSPEQESTGGPQPELPSQRRRREILESRKLELEKKLGNLNDEMATPITPSQRGTVISKTQMSSNLETDTGHDIMDKALWQHDARQGLEFIYPEYFKMLSEGKKITPEVIHNVKGRTSNEVKEKHEEYIQKIIDGELKPTQPKFLIADKLEGQAVNKKKPGKIKVKRR
jgi:hypothetical protein